MPPTYDLWGLSRMPRAGAQDVPLPNLPARPPVRGTTPIGVPTPPMDWESQFADKTINYPSGFNPGESVPGNMSSSRPPFAPNELSGALQGLAASQSTQDPRLARIGLAYDSRSQDGYDTGYGANILADVNRSFAPQRTEVDRANAALMAQHPAIRGLAKTEAQQKAFPSQAQAAGQIEAADLQAEAIQRKAILDAISEKNKLRGGQFAPVLESITKLQTAPTHGANRIDPAQQQQAIQALYSLLSQIMGK